MPYTLPASEFIGVWQRASIAVGSGDPYEDSNVLWLHTGDYFADIRWPKLGKQPEVSSAFAGRSFWEPPLMRFIHEVDLTKEFNQDEGHLSFLNGQLIEKGQVTVDREVTHFQEVWSRTARSTREYCQVASKSEDHSIAYIIKVCDYVIALEESDEQFSAAAWKHDGEVWTLQIASGQTEYLTALLGAFLSDSLAPPWTVNI